MNTPTTIPCPPPMPCTCGGEVDFERSIGTMDGGLEGLTLVLANCTSCGTTRAVEHWHSTRRDVLG